MSAETGDEYSAGTSPEDFLEPDDPDEPGETAASGDAPYGWTTDPATGRPRPKIRPGRPRKPPSPEQLAEQPPVDRADDRPPAPPQRGHGGRGGKKDDDRPEVPMPRGGVIADGVNRLYRRAGKIVRALDADIGQAVIECTRADDEDEITVGEAWERLCKANPRIRAFILKCIAGGAYGELIMAHLPIGVAIIMKPGIQRFINPGRLIESMAEPDEDTPEGEGGLPGGMTAADAGEMRDLAEQQMRKMASKMGVQVSAADLKAARAAADQLSGNGAPARRAQPKRTTRAQRAGH